MRSTFSQLYYINRAKVKTDGTTAVMCRITIDGKNTALTTDIYCRPEDWNAKKKKPTTLLQMGEWERERLRIRANELNKVNTYRQSKSLQAHLQEYLHSLGKKDIPLTDIDEAFGQGYKVHLVKGKNLGPAQANHCLIQPNRERGI